MLCKYNDKNDKFYREVAFFTPQRLKAASKLKPHRGLGTRLPSP